MTESAKTPGWAGMRVATLALLCVSAGTALMLAPAAGAATPLLVITPAGPGYGNGQSITISVGPNTLFTPESKVNVLECADPGGTAANLPKDDTTCDGNTIQNTSVLVGHDGSLELMNYTMYSLPSATLGEQGNGQPVCNATNECVLYVGQDQNDFTQPKLLSAPFTVGPASATTSTNSTSPSPTGGAPAGATSPASIPGSVTSAQLAFTGTPVILWWLAATGGLLCLLGAVGLRRTRRVKQ